MITLLDRSVLLHIFSFLEAEQVLSVGMVCKHFYEVTNDPEVWEQLVITSLDNLSVMSGDMPSPRNSDSASFTDTTLEDHNPSVDMVRNLRKGRVTNEVPLLGHKKAVGCVATSARYGVSGAADGSVRVWELSRNVCIGAVRAHSDKVGSLAISEEDDMVVSGAHDGSVTIVRQIGSRPTVEKTISLHRSRVRALIIAFPYLISGSADSTVKITNMSNGECLATGKNQCGISGMSMRNDKSSFVVGGEDGTITLWSLSLSSTPSLSAVQSLFGHAGPVSSVQYFNDNMMASASVDTTIRIWNMDSKKCLKTLRGHTAPVTRIKVLKDGKLLVSAGHDKRVRVFETDTGRPMSSIKTAQAVRSMDLDEQAGAMLTCGDGAKVIKYDFTGSGSTGLTMAHLAMLPMGSPPISRAKRLDDDVETASVSSWGSYTSIGSVGSVNSTTSAPDPGMHGSRRKSHAVSALRDPSFALLSPGQRLYSQGLHWQKMKEQDTKELEHDLEMKDRMRRIPKINKYDFGGSRDDDFLKTVENDRTRRKERMEALQVNLERFRNPEGKPKITKMAQNLQREGSVFERLYSEAKKSKSKES